MSAMDFAAALGGGAPPGAGPPGVVGGGAPPPDLGPPPEAAAPPGGEDTFQNSLEALDVAEEALHAFIQLDPDEIDRAQAGQALQTVLKLKAANQKSVQSGDMKSLQRALAGGNQIAGPPAAAGPGPGPGGPGGPGY